MDLQEENKMLKDLLKETMAAMCDYRTLKGKCANCKSLVYCRARKIIPQVEKILHIKKDCK